MQMRKKLYIFKHFAKSKKVFFLPISIILRLIPIKFKTLKPPIVLVPTQSEKDLKFVPAEQIIVLTQHAVGEAINVQKILK